MTTQSEMTEELNCSEGARMLIERMQTHPDDFKPGGRFYRIAEQVMGLAPRGYGELSDRDDTALSDAYGNYILEPQLTEFVVDEIFNGDKRREEEQKAYAQTGSTYSQRLAHSMMATKNQMATGLLVGSGFNDPRLTYGSPVSNPAPQPGQLIAASNTSITAGQQWFEEEKKRLSEMTAKTLAKLKRNKAK